MEPNQTIEALDTQLQTLSVSTDYIDVANALSFELLYSSRDAERANVLAKEIVDLCIRRFTTYKKGLAEALINLAFYHADQSDLQEALRLILQAAQIVDELNDTDVSFKLMKIQRFIYALLDDYSSAISVSFDRMTLAQEVDNPHEAIAALEALVYDCYRINEYSQALAYSEKAFVLARRLDDAALLAHTHMYHTYPLRKLGHYDLALQHAQEAYRFYKGQRNRDETFCLSILGYIHLEMEEYERSMDCFQQVHALLQSLNISYLLAYNDCTIGMVHLAAGRVEQAIQCLKTGIEWAESQNSKTLLLEKYPYLVQAYKANQNYEQALAVFEKLAEIRTEIYNIKAVNQRNALLVIHETEQAQLEAKLQQERAEMLQEQAENLAYQNALIQKIDALKDELVATASHDIRSPLGAMQLDLDLLQYTVSGNEAAQRTINRLVKNVAHMAYLIKDLLDFSNLQERVQPELARCDLSALILDTLTRYESARMAKGIRLEMNLPESPLSLAVDAHQMTRVLDNLVNNAIKYSDTGGTMTVSLSRTDKQVTIAIGDTGRGIPAAEIPYIFDRQYRASNSIGEPGEGNGLAIVRTLVRNHQGEILCESVLGQGTTFTINLPAGSDAAAAAHSDL